MSDLPFWETKPLGELSLSEWESLCDKCGKCCVLKLEDIDTEFVYYTDVACKMLDCKTGHCSDYTKRLEHVPDCIKLSPESIELLPWMPKTCAYRLIYEGKKLPDWHPLISGKKETVALAGHSVAGKVLPEGSVEEKEMPDHIKNWDHPV